MVKNGGPDLKRAQRTCLSARRARRTKSRGPKGLQLEVWARRAPRLLVINIIVTLRSGGVNIRIFIIVIVIIIIYEYNHNIVIIVIIITIAHL